MVLTGRRPLVEAAFLAGTGPGALVIDATGMSEACALDCTGMVATAHWADAAAIEVTLVMPDDETAASYLEQVGLVQAMPRSTRLRGRRASTTNHRPGVLGVTALNPRNIKEVAERLGPMVTEFYADRASAGAAVLIACIELMGNATEHGRSDRGAFIAVQTYPETASQGRRLEFAVCDTGVGVKDRLRENRQYAHLTKDRVAIAESLRAGVSGVRADLRDGGRGNGLNDAIESRRVGHLGLQIRSGRGEVRVTASPSGRDIRPLDRDDQTSGTWAWLTHQLAPPDQTALQSSP